MYIAAPIYCVVVLFITAKIDKRLSTKFENLVDEYRAIFYEDYAGRKYFYFICILLSFIPVLNFVVAFFATLFFLTAIFIAIVKSERIKHLIEKIF